MKNLKASLLKWFLRYVKYNVIGVSVFLLNIVLYYTILFPVFGEQAYIIVSLIGGVVEFVLISYFNRTKVGIMFETGSSVDDRKD